MACHTRAPGIGGLDASQETKIARLAPLEKAHFYASTRQFERALDGYAQVLSGASASAFDRERAARGGLAIAVRVNQDPERALSIVQAFEASPRLPEYMRALAGRWRASVDVWKRERPRAETTEEGMYQEAQRLLAEGKRQQAGPLDRAAEIYYLRASSTLHAMMARYPQGRHATEALLLTGVSYDVLDGMYLWELQEPYYLACIKRSPHTELAQQCYRRYEESRLLGFTGSAGLNIPEDVRVQLEAVKLEAWPAPAGAPQPN
jgi:hypothetical protein